MKTLRSLPRTTTFQIFAFAIWAAVSLRWIIIFVAQSHPYLWLLSAFLLVYGMLVMLQPIITRGPDYKAHLYFGVQTVIINASMMLFYEIDFFGLLFMPLAVQALFRFPRKTAYVWITIFALVMSIGQMIQFGRLEGVSFVFLYLAALLLIVYFVSLMLRADEARIQSDQLLDELQQAHQKLQTYAGQAEELAVAKERNRLARELHDSVAQTLYGLTLQAEAALRKLSFGETSEVASYLREIRDSSQQTLKETRLLIFELRPPVLEKEGLAPALRARLESVESRSGLKTQVNLQEVGRLPVGVETGLYGISSEVLNNILKHAHASEIRVSLQETAGRVVLEIADNGIGFDPEVSDSQGGLGLKGMKERAEQIGGRLQICSGEKGTQVKMEVACE
jgi:signal transduction histidine kinase